MRIMGRSNPHASCSGFPSIAVSKKLLVPLVPFIDARLEHFELRYIMLDLLLRLRKSLAVLSFLSIRVTG